MSETSRTLPFPKPAGHPSGRPAGASSDERLEPPLTLAFPALPDGEATSSSPGRAASRTAGFPIKRCRERGCVFPARPEGYGKCLQHDRQEREPALFLSFQPSMLLLDRAKFGPPDPARDDSRAQDRRRLAALREAFLEEVA